ncbi:MAG: 4-hydroxy-tetrahydrodipicolinate reductase [Bacteroidia bacterium]|nr:4-hydroxy-tetrahydrodipicolinate reductase [Bacteroidia bacterium]
MNIAIIGFGKMGQTIEQIAKERNHHIAAIFDLDNPLSVDKLNGVDVAIEFSLPKSAVKNIKICSDAGVPVVVGTTGWYDHYEGVKETVLNSDGALLAATNFSLGVNITFYMNEILAKIMSNYPYSVGITETHHTQKLDAPSGTAISLGEGVLNNHAQLLNWKLTEQLEYAHKGDLPIQALREENVPGTHVIEYKNAIDSIQLKHTAFNRHGFASGAVDAAEWIVGRKGVYTIQDMFNFGQYL